MGPLQESAGYRYRRSHGRELLAECEAFLAGDLPLGYLRRGTWVPEWAWLSMLAHASPDKLAAYAAAGPRVRPYNQLEVTWSRAVALLAHELLAVSERTGVGVGDLQRAVLVEMELRGDRQRRASWVEGPGRLVDEVRFALDGFRRRRRGARPNPR